MEKLVLGWLIGDASEQFGFIRFKRPFIHESARGEIAKANDCSRVCFAKKRGRASRARIVGAVCFAPRGCAADAPVGARCMLEKYAQNG